MKSTKIFLGIIGLSILGMILWFGIGMINDSIKESKFSNYEIPDYIILNKPIKNFNRRQIDSLQKLRVEKNKLELNGQLGSYGFFMWYKPTEKGEIYVRAFEIAKNIELSRDELYDGTRNKIEKSTNKMTIYEGSSTIYEGTFEVFFPVRFELWFKSEKSGKEIKLAEKEYLIEGWDR